MFKEPQIHRSTLTLRDEGSLSGWAVTAIGIALFATFMWFAIAFYESYTPLHISTSDDGSQPIGLNTLLTMSFQAYASFRGVDIESRLTGTLQFLYVFASYLASNRANVNCQTCAETQSTSSRLPSTTRASCLPPMLRILCAQDFTSDHTTLLYDISTFNSARTAYILISCLIGRLRVAGSAPLLTIP